MFVSSLRRILPALAIMAFAQSAHAQFGETFDGFDPSAVEAVFEAYDAAEAELAARVTALESRGITVYGSSVDVIDVTHVSYTGGIWHMRITVILFIDTCGPPCEP